MPLGSVQEASGWSLRLDLSLLYSLYSPIQFTEERRRILSPELVQLCPELVSSEMVGTEAKNEGVIF